MGTLLIDLVMCSVVLLATFVGGQKPPIPDFCTVYEKSPCMMLVRQDDAVKIVAAEAVDPACSEVALNNPVVDQALLHVASGQHDAERTVPGVVMQASIRVTGEKTVDIGAAASGQAKQVIAFQIGLALIAPDDAAAQHAGEFKQQLVDEADFCAHGGAGW